MSWRPGVAAGEVSDALSELLLVPPGLVLTRLGVEGPVEREEQTRDQPHQVGAGLPAPQKRGEEACHRSGGMRRGGGRPARLPGGCGRRLVASEPKVMVRLVESIDATASTACECTAMKDNVGYRISVKMGQPGSHRP